MNETRTWPISRCKGPSLTEWEFVKEMEGTYEQALKEAGQLYLKSASKGEPWHYRIWDCR